MVSRFLACCSICLLSVGSFVWASSESSQQRVSIAVSDNVGATSMIGARESGLLFTIHGSNTIGAKLAPTWAKAYLEAKGLANVALLPGEKDNEYFVEGENAGEPVYIAIYAHGSSTGFKGLKENSADIAMSSRPIKAVENRSIDSRNDLTRFESEHVVAIDGLAVIVHPSNPLNALNKSEVARIFSGEFINWRELGGPDLPIRLYARDNKSGTWDTFKNIVLAKKYKLSAFSRRFESNDRLSEHVSQDVQAIGFVGLASVLSSKALAISDDETQAIFPEPIYVATEDYPLARRLFMYSVPDKGNYYSREFLQFVQTEVGQKIVEDVGFVSQKPVALAVNPLDGPSEYNRVVKNGERLSVNFRFNIGSATLDNKAKHDVSRLVSFMSLPENRDKLVQLIGFGDAKSTEQRAVLLSKLRALSVKSALHRLGVYAEPVTGFGADLPVASLSGGLKHKNQRVEVWVFDPQHKASLSEAKSLVNKKYKEELTSRLVLFN
ncbi:MAG: substrate-binding domain-containing protein [Agarilytica sp.]